MDLHIPEGTLCEGRCTMLCTICNRQSEVLSEGNLTSSIMRRKLQCGHSRLFRNYLLDIERIRGTAKAAKFCKIDSLISELNQIIRVTLVQISFSADELGQHLPVREDGWPLPNRIRRAVESCFGPSPRSHWSGRLAGHNLDSI